MHGVLQHLLNGSVPPGFEDQQLSDDVTSCGRFEENPIHDSMDVIEENFETVEEIQINDIFNTECGGESTFRSPCTSFTEEKLEESENQKRNESFLGFAELANKYTIKERVEDDAVTRQKNEICALFSKHGCTEAAQRDFLNAFRTIRPETQRSLPVQGRTLRPGTIPHIILQLEPGELAYFGITSILSLSRFYDPNENIIRLSINIDGVPPFRSSSYNFWPILGSVDDHPEFMIAIYGGRGKPKCSNQFLDIFVQEIRDLYTNGMSLHGITYRFELVKILMDVPATSYILGTKGHGGYWACRRCHTKGRSIQLPGRVSKNGRPCTKVCYPRLDAPERMSDDFNIHFDLVGHDPHVHTSKKKSKASTLKNFSAPKTNPLPDIIQHHSDDDLSDSDEEEEDDSSFWEHHLHPTILTLIKKLDLVRDVPYDYMHMILLNIIRTMILLWKNNKTRFSFYESYVCNRLRYARDHCPLEFQRWPEKDLNHVKKWKAHQCRVFLLYTGIFILKGLIGESFFKHFCNLVIVSRLMCRKVLKNENRATILKNVANCARPLIRTFILDGISLYGDGFATYNVHCLSHCPEDYERFGPLDEYSNFRYESFLGWLKKQVLSGNNPMQQIVNKYSTHLLLGTMRKTGSRPPELLNQFFEKPEWVIESQKDDVQALSIIRHRGITLRANNDRDCHVYVKGFLVKITAMFRYISKDSIIIFGRKFEKAASIFDGRDSLAVGMGVFSQLSSKTESWEIDEIDDKCFAFPLSSTSEQTEWAMARFLH